MQSLQNATNHPDEVAGVSAHGIAEQVNELIRVVQFRDRDRVCCHGLTVSECHALKILDDEDGLTVNALAGELYLDKSTTSRLARGMESKGLVRRERDPGDGRQVRIQATGKGRSAVRGVMDDLADEYAEILEGVGPEGRETVSRVLRRITASLAARIEVEGGRCCVIDGP
jgi:DNA-binding MarR family transcriptional regulator